MRGDIIDYTDRLMEVRRRDRPKSSNRSFYPSINFASEVCNLRARFKSETKSVSSIIFLYTKITHQNLMDERVIGSSSTISK